MPKESTNNPQPKLDLSPTSSSPGIVSTSQYHSQPSPPSPLDHSLCAQLTSYNSSHTQSSNFSSLGYSSNKGTFKDPVTKLIWRTRKATSKEYVVAALLPLGYDDHSIIVDRNTNKTNGNKVWYYSHTTEKDLIAKI